MTSGQAPQVTVLADDLTGAADSGVMFANHGLTTMVVWSRAETPDMSLDRATVPAADAQVVSSESRDCEQAEAVRRVQRCVTQYIHRVDTPWVYKKIDSTLRGHPGAELAALLEGIGCPRALVAPAFPAQGRTTIGGVHRVHGVRLDKTVFGEGGVSAEVARPFAEAFGSDTITSLSLETVRRGVDAVSDEMRATDTRVIVADAETTEDLKTLVRAAQQCGISVLCGSAGLASALGSVVTWHSEVLSPIHSPVQGDLILVVAASRHPRTRDQILTLLARGVPIVTPPVEGLTDPDASMDAVIQELMTVAARAPSGLSPIALTSVGLPLIDGPGSLITRKLGVVVREFAERGRLAGMIVTGGDTAIAIAEALGVEALWLRGEVRSGVPWGTWLGGAGAGVPVVTKAGGFGETDVLVAAIDHIRTLSRGQR